MEETDKGRGEDIERPRRGAIGGQDEQAIVMHEAWPPARSPLDIDACRRMEMPGHQPIGTALRLMRQRQPGQVQLRQAMPANGMRLSPHRFNTAADIDKALKAIEAELG